MLFIMPLVNHCNTLSRLIKLYLFVVLGFLHFGVEPCHGNDFDRQYFGVTFSPFVKHPENFQTIMEVVSRKFSNVYVTGLGTKSDPSINYNGSSPIVWVSEAAAMINHENSFNLLKITIGLQQYDSQNQTKAEILSALEAINKSNNIYSGTVQALCFNYDLNYNGLSTTLESLTMFRSSAHDHKIQLGSWLDCDNVISQQNDTLAQIQQQVVNEADFVICLVSPSASVFERTPEESVGLIGNNLLLHRHHLTNINTRVNIKALIDWPSIGIENAEFQKRFWHAANEWAVEHSFEIFMMEPFDYLYRYIEKSADLKSDEEEQEENNSLVTVGIVLAVIIALCIFICIALLILRMKRLKNDLTKTEIQQFLYGITGRSEKAEIIFEFPYNISYELPKDQFKIDYNQVLGTDQFGCVYKAIIEQEEYNSVCEVALKVARKHCQKRALKGLMTEIKVLSYLGNHDNIVSLQGAYTEELTKGIVYVATELCEFGTLENYLRNNESKRNMVSTVKTLERQSRMEEMTKLTTILEINFLDLVRWSWELACGMEFLEMKHIVHGNLTAGNVLLSSERQVKITDFSLSHYIHDNKSCMSMQNDQNWNQEPISWRWLAIESLRSNEHSYKSDVWMYGVTLWEIFSLGDKPYAGLSWSTNFVNSLLTGLRLNFPPFASPDVYKIVSNCWYTEAKERPSFTQLKESFAIIMEKCDNELIETP